MSADRLALMRAFAEMYRAKRFDADGFDYDGYLQTTLSDDDRMPMEFFVEYNNAWWFEIISGVSVPHVAYDADSDTGSIVLDIDYAGDTLRAMQHVRAFEATAPTAAPIARIRDNLAELDRRLAG